MCRLNAAGSLDGSGIRLFLGDASTVDTLLTEMHKKRPAGWGSLSASGRLVYVPAAELDRVGALAKQRGLPPASALSLGYAGTPLESGRTLASYGIKDSGFLWHMVRAIFSPIIQTDAPFMILWENQPQPQQQTTQTMEQKQ